MKIDENLFVFYRIGGTKKRTVKTRIISATYRDLAGLVEKDVFRNDLYHRFAVVKLVKGNESKAALLLNLTRDKFRYRRNKLNGVR